MDSFIYDDKEIQCFCFDTIKNKNRNGLRPAPNSTDQRESLKNRGVVKSVEQKFNQMQGSRTKKSLKREKPKTPTREIFKSAQYENHKKVNLPELKRETQRAPTQAAFQWNENFQHEPININASKPLKVEKQQKSDKRNCRFRNANYRISVEPIKFENSKQIYQEPIKSTPHKQFFSPKIVFTSHPENNNFNSGGPKSLQLKEQKPRISMKYKSHQFDIQGYSQNQGNRKIYPKEIESVVDENELEEDEISEVEWGWSNEQRKRGQKTQGNRLQTLNTMASNIKNSSIKNSLFGVAESQFTKL